MASGLLDDNLLVVEALLLLLGVGDGEGGGEGEYDAEIVHFAGLPRLQYQKILTST